jgi:hypothetical protein
MTHNTPLAYTTILTHCVRLAEKGLLERRHVTAAEKPARPGKAYVYAPRLSEEAFTRAAIERYFEPFLAQYPALVQEQIAGVPSRRPSGTIGSDRAQVEYILAYLGTLSSIRRASRSTTACWT